MLVLLGSLFNTELFYLVIMRSISLRQAALLVGNDGLMDLPVDCP